MTPDLRDSLLNWLARREFELRAELGDKNKNHEFVKGELVSVMETTAFVLTGGIGF